MTGTQATKFLRAAEYSNKKIEGLRRKRERWAKQLETADEDTKWYYENQIALIDYDLEDAVKSEAKRRTRLALKHIERKLSEIDALRKQVGEVLSEDVPLDWTERMNFRDELEKTIDLAPLLYGGRY